MAIFKNLAFLVFLISPYPEQQQENGMLEVACVSVNFSLTLQG